MTEYITNLILKMMIIIINVNLDCSALWSRIYIPIYIYSSTFRSMPLLPSLPRCNSFIINPPPRRPPSRTSSTSVCASQGGDAPQGRD